MGVRVVTPLRPDRRRIMVQRPATLLHGRACGSPASFRSAINSNCSG
jgi:hypothetical protein